jgi:ferredoxin-type protein NapG
MRGRRVPGRRRPAAAGRAGRSRFLAACVRCGLCVRDCPYDILHLATPGQPVANGTPYFVARDKPCEMCVDLPCVKACPTGALDPALTDVNQARMGLAVLVDQEHCLNFLGLRCDICYRVCPAIDKAITLEQQLNTRTGKHAQFIPVVHSDACTGCGKCEKSCPLQTPAIKVLPRALAMGEPGDHYRLGWEEKERAGGSLVAADPEHHYNLPEGLRYDNGRLWTADARGSPGASARPQPARPRAPAGGQAVKAGTRPGAEAVAAKGWLAAHRWLLLRRSSQLLVLALFLSGPGSACGSPRATWPVQPDPGRAAADRPLCAAAVAAGGPRAAAHRAAGCGHRAGASTCWWAGALLQLGVSDERRHRRQRLAAHAAEPAQRRPPAAQHCAGGCWAPRWWWRGQRQHRLGAGQPGVDAAARADLRRRRQPGPWWRRCSCSTWPWCPAAGAATCARWARLQRDRPRQRAARCTAARREACNDCADCYAVCPEPLVIKPALKAVDGAGPVIQSAQCTNCGRCIDVCSKDVFSLRHPLPRQTVAAPPAVAPKTL